jgi:putative transposase
MGLGKLVYLSDGSVIDNPRFSTNKKTRHLMKVRQRRVNRKQKGSKNRSKAQQLVNQLHNKIAQRRESHQWDAANRIVKKADAIAVEDLNISGIMKRCKPVKSEKGRFLSNGQSAKRGLNRSIADASWYALTQKIEYLAAKSGKRLYRVNPKHTSQTCSQCGHIDRASRNGEKFICTNCGHIYSNPKSFMQICRGGAKSARPPRDWAYVGVGTGALPLQILMNDLGLL